MCKNIALFLLLISILISSFVVDTKSQKPVRTMVMKCTTMKIAEDYIKIYSNNGYSLKQLSPYTVKLTNSDWSKSDRINEMMCVNNYLLIMQK